MRGSEQVYLNSLEDFSTTPGPPNGPAGGDLTGTYPAPVLINTNLAIGAFANAFSSFSIAAGQSSSVSATQAIGIGYSTFVNGTDTVCLGAATVGNAADSVCVGTSSTSNSVAQSISIGKLAAPNNTSHALALQLNAASVLPGTLGVTINGVNKQIQQYPSFGAVNALGGAGTTTLNYSSAKSQYFTGAFTQNIVLPQATSGQVGYELKISNVSSGNLSIYADAGLTQLVTTLAAPVPAVTRGGWGLFTIIGTGADTAANWSAELGSTSL